MTRKQFIATAGGGLASLAGAPSIPAAERGRDVFRFAVIADTHIIDEFYKGPEGNPEDTESIFKTSERLAATRDFLNVLQPKMERVFVVGDYFHNYPSTDPGFFEQHTTRIDNAKKLTDGFKMPVHIGFGNHDYGVPKVSREMSHDLFRRKLGVEPYYSVDHKGVKFVHLNNFLGVTWDSTSPRFKKDTGSLGEEQLNWFEAELRQHKPTFVFVHYPLLIIAPTEVKDYGLPSLLKKYRDTVQLVVSGHWHKWAEFGRTFGPPHQVMAATRYDPNAYLIVEVNTAKATHRLLNLDLVDWNTHYSKPWRAGVEAAVRAGSAPPSVARRAVPI